MNTTPPRSRTVRHLRLLSSLVDMDWQDFDGLAARLGVDRRTLTRDLQQLRELGIPLQRADRSLRVTPQARRRLRAIMLGPAGDAVSR